MVGNHHNLTKELFGINHKILLVEFDMVLSPKKFRGLQ